MSDEPRLLTDEKAAKLRAPFPPEKIGKLPKAGKQLDFVGHAHVTERLLEVDPEWTWEPMAKTVDGFPIFDADGGLWIRLTVCGVRRPGYGEPGRIGPKEAIGDAIRNAAMRFGVALDLWMKDSPEGVEVRAGGGSEPATGAEPPPSNKRASDDQWAEVKTLGKQLGGLVGADEAAILYARFLEGVAPQNPASLTGAECARLIDVLRREVENYQSGIPA